MAAKSTKSTKSEPVGRPVDDGRLAVRGLTDEDHARIDRVVELEREALARARPGATISKNAVLVELLREALARRLDGGSGG